jgi:PAS domain S-box-containing protein
MAERATDPATRENAPYEYRIIRPDGEMRWVAARGRAIFAGKGRSMRAVRYLGVIQDINETKRLALALEASEGRLRESEEQLRALAANLPGGIIYQGEVAAGGERRFTFVSSNCERLHGVSAEDAMTDSTALYGLIAPEDLPSLVAAEEGALASGGVLRHEFRARRPDGTWRWHSVTAAPREVGGGRVLWDGLQIDIDERKRAEDALQRLNADLEQRVAVAVRERLDAEEALRQAQKMEVLGQLTGGVAHDFNNLLTIIMGGLDTIRRSAPDQTDRIARATAMALQGAERAASLTSRLLAFSRRQSLDPRPCDVTVQVGEMTTLLRRTLGETIEMECRLGEALWPVETDCNQLEAALLNLALNARDAMPSGGRLRLETANEEVGPDSSLSPREIASGQYVTISVSDTGVGIPKEALSRVFEPFFTTKEVGKGTGLGLSMVYGFAKQSGGHVTVGSQEGQGTTVKLYLPRQTGWARPPLEISGPPPPVSRRGELVLVVEDNQGVRAYSRSVFEDLGYRVLEAGDAEQALAILAERPEVDLLFTDVVLPGRSGRDLAAVAVQLHPGLGVLLTTGYARDAFDDDGRLKSGVNLIAKPFTFDQLARRVHSVLETRANWGRQRST